MTPTNPHARLAEVLAQSRDPLDIRQRGEALVLAYGGPDAEIVTYDGRTETLATRRLTDAELRTIGMGDMATFEIAIHRAPIRPAESRALVWPLVVMVLAFAAVALLAWHLGMAAHASAVAQGALMMEGGL